MARRTVFAIIAVWVFIFAFETLFHGIMLRGFYVDLAGFRPEQEGVDLLPLLITGHLALAVGLVLVVCRIGKAESLSSAALIGALLAITFGAGSSLLQYVALEIPFSLLVFWMGGGILEFALGGALARVIHGQP